MHDTLSITAARSQCPHCLHTLAWYDLIPVVSWSLLRGKCRYCQSSISFLYPTIELFTACIGTYTVYLFIDSAYLFSYLFFFSALIITIRSDIETFLISRFVTLALIPIALFLSFFNLIPITLSESIAGTFLGYFFLWIVAKVFLLLTKKDGMGEGDFELLAFIGSCVGPCGVWYTIMISSITGSLLGILYLIITGTREQLKIPFGPFLAIGAISYIVFYDTIIEIIMLAC